MSDEIKIPLSNKKTTLGMIGCLFFIIISIWFILDPQKFLNFKRQNELIIIIVGIFGLLLFSMFLIFFIYKLFEKDKGLFFKKEGFVDNSGGASAGYVKWEDVIELEETKVSNQRFILVLLKNPDDYVNKQKSLVKRKLMSSNNSIYGSPVQISTNFLKIQFDDLLELMNSQFELYNSIK